MTLNDLDEQSLWLFMKWVAIDGVFLFGLPGLRIPWLEWSPSTMTLLFCLHAFLDGMLMFRIPIPIGAGVAAVGRSVYGAYEMAVNEHTVNPESIRFNDSLILGRQVIHILPEGMAELNPEREAFCIDNTRTEVKLPIMINATNPIAMDLVRIDLDNQASNKTIHISKSQIKRMHSEAKRLLSYSEDPNQPKTLYHSVKEPGLYMLAKVVDETNLEVRRKRMAHTVVAACPKAKVKPSSADRCRGELSNVEFEVTGAPPLSVKYRKVINQIVNEGTIENILPSEDFTSPLAKRGQSALVVPAKMEVAWARSQTSSISVSESLGSPGHWLYQIDEVRDAFGNMVKYSGRQHDEHQKHMAKSSPLHQAITVHERPTVHLQGCSPQNPLKVARGQTANLPVRFGSAGASARSETPAGPYHLDVLFSAHADVSATGEHGDTARTLDMTLKDANQIPTIKEAGLYTVTGVRTDFCQGDVLEPASCVLQNPPQPRLSITKEEISDKCAGSPVGLRVGLDLVGTPPFEVSYRVRRKSEKIHINEVERVSGLRGQIELTPRTAGHYYYEFIEVSDAVYKHEKISGIMLEQDVKPSASARFLSSGEKRVSCIDELVKFPVMLQGEGPFTVAYVLNHGQRRATYTQENITGDTFEIETEALKDGGDYTLALASITDEMGCTEHLKDQVTVSVRHQKPKVGFRSVDGSRSMSALEGKQVQLPLRLEGDAPWNIKYKDTTGRLQSITAQSANDRVAVSAAGMYELVDVSDNTCPGVVDETAKNFDVAWILRPEMRIRGDDVTEQRGTFHKRDVCEGDEDAVDLLFQGAPSFNAQYMQHTKLDKGTTSPKKKELRATSHIAPLRMDTSQAGLYRYEFNKLTDANYDHSANTFKPLTLQQRVDSRPSAAFSNPGKTYSYCSVESSGEEVIPITLHGEPPFDLEVEIKHHGTARPETVSLTHITSKTHNIRIPHSRLHLGKSAVSLRRVSDSRGCARLLDGSSRVHISVHDAPTITELESHTDFCVGDRINFALSGTPPFNVFYTFEGAQRKAISSSTTFRRLAESPGEFTITGVQDSASTCKSSTQLTKHIHGLPSVRVSRGQDAYVDIHEGDEAEILFEFWGVPPFEFTYTRSSNTEKHGKRPGTVLDMRSEVSEGYSLRVHAREEGTYEVVSIKDAHCAYAKPGVKVGGKEQKRLKY